MRVVLAPDSFKECLAADAVCAALRQGVVAAVPTAMVEAVPLADGGEGTLAAVRAALGANAICRRVCGPLGVPVMASYSHAPAAGLAVIETAAACGLMLVPPASRNPLLTTTRGAGELARDALDRGANHLMFAIGGSATVDGGTGLARALGYEFVDRDDRPLPDGGGALVDLARIRAPALRPWAGVSVEVACDVTNPLLGASGAARVYGPQKGAAPEMVERLEAGLARLATIIQRDLGVAVAELPGAGAAGGLGAGLVAFMGARLRSGIELVMEVVALPARLAGADLVITGEGCTDGQTLSGKVCAGVARLARRQGVPCVVISGSVAERERVVRELGLAGAFSICPGPLALADAIAQAPALLAATADSVVRLFVAGRRPVE